MFGGVNFGFFPSRRILSFVFILAQCTAIFNVFLRRSLHRGKPPPRYVSPIYFQFPRSRLTL